MNHDDYPDSICRHLNPEDPEEERYITVTSAIMDLEDLSLRLTDGPPCEHLYDGYTVIRATWRQLESEPELILVRVATALERRRLRAA